MKVFDQTRRYYRKNRSGRFQILWRSYSYRTACVSPLALPMLPFLSPDHKYRCQCMSLPHCLTRVAIDTVLDMVFCAAMRLWRGTSELEILARVYATRGEGVASCYPRDGSPCLSRSRRLYPQRLIPLNISILATVAQPYFE